MSEDKKRELPKRHSNVDMIKYEKTTYYKDDGKTKDYEIRTYPNGEVKVIKYK